MILAHRRRHRAVFVALAVLVPAAVLVSVVARDPLPVAASLPPELAPEPVPPEHAGGLRWARSGPLWEELAVEIARVPNPDGIPRIAFRPTRDLRSPELLVYWAPGPGPFPDVPSGAALLGTLAGAATAVFTLPTRMREVEGSFLVYSLGHQRVLGRQPTRPTVEPD